MLAASLVLLPSASAQPVADTSCSAASNGNLTGVNHYVQVFTALNSGSLTSASVEIVNSSAGNDYTMGIMAVDASGQPTGSLVATKDLPNLAAITTNTVVVGDFAVPAHVEAGKKYGLSFQITPGQAFTIGATTSAATCPGELYFRNFIPDPYSLVAGRSLLFSTFVEPDPVVPPTVSAPAPLPASPPSAVSLAGVPASMSLSKFLAGVKLAVQSTSPTAFDAELQGTVRKARLSAFNLQLASASLAQGTGKRTLVLKPSRRLVGSVKRAIKVRLKATAISANGLRTASTKTIKVTPRKKPKTRKH